MELVYTISSQMSLRLRLSNKSDKTNISYRNEAHGPRLSPEITALMTLKFSTYISAFYMAVSTDFDIAECHNFCKNILFLLFFHKTVLGA